MIDQSTDTVREPEAVIFPEVSELQSLFVLAGSGSPQSGHGDLNSQYLNLKLVCYGESYVRVFRVSVVCYGYIKDGGVTI